MERSFLFNLGLREYEFCVALCSIFLLSIVDWKSRNETIVDWLNEKGFYFRGGFVYTVVMLTLMFGQFGNQAFIYFQF